MSYEIDLGTGMKNICRMRQTSVYTILLGEEMFYRLRAIRNMFAVCCHEMKRMHGNSDDVKQKCPRDVSEGTVVDIITLFESTYEVC